VVTWRGARPDDDEFLRALFAAVHPELASLPDPPREHILEMQFRAQRASYSQVLEVEFLVVLDGEVPIGQYVIAPSDQGVQLLDISVLPEARGQGIATLILRELLSSGRPLTLQVAHGNPARELYERLGLREISRDEIRAVMRSSVIS
jgi:ribosomal protein S18 acetylase RimI-like enzyme